MCDRENRNRGPTTKLRSWTFVSQPLCCAIPVHHMLLFFLLFPLPAPLPWPGVLILACCPSFLGLLGSCAGISCTSAAGAEGVVSRTGLVGVLGNSGSKVVVFLFLGHQEA